MTGSSAPRDGRLRVGVAGLGAVAQAVHLPLLARLPDAYEIGALCDLSPALRAAIGDRYAVPPDRRVGSVAELLELPGLDGLLLLTSGSHGADALAALDRGLPVLCEKPLAFTAAEADVLAASPHADASCSAT
jgi:predicted dehydrogenase